MRTSKHVVKQHGKGPLANVLLIKPEPSFHDGLILKLDT